eukprot:g11677.t1
MAAKKIPGRAGKDLEVDPVSTLELGLGLGAGWFGNGIGRGLAERAQKALQRVPALPEVGFMTGAIGLMDKARAKFAGGGARQATDQDHEADSSTNRENAGGQEMKEAGVKVNGQEDARGAADEGGVNADEGLRDDVKEDELARGENSRVPETIRSLGKDVAEAGRSAIDTVGGGLTSLKQMVAGAVPGSASSRGPGGRDENVGDGAEATGQENVMQTLGEANKENRMPQVKMDMEQNQERVLVLLRGLQRQPEPVRRVVQDYLNKMVQKTGRGNNYNALNMLCRLWRAPMKEDCGVVKSEAAVKLKNLSRRLQHFAINKHAEYCALPAPECNDGGSAIFPHKSIAESSANVLVDVFGVKSQDVKLEDRVQLCRLQWPDANLAT